VKRSLIIEIISFFFILLFVYTAGSKLVNLEGFRSVISYSPIIGQQAAVVSWLMPITELLIALLLVIPQTRRIGLLVSAVLMLLFTLYVSYMLASMSKLPCSCGGILKQMTWPQHLVFNIVFTLVAFTGYRLGANPGSSSEEPSSSVYAGERV